MQRPFPRALRALSVLAAVSLVLTACPAPEPEPVAEPEVPEPEQPEPEEPEPELSWVMVTDPAGLGDEGFNDLAWEGTTRAADQFGGEPIILESRELADMEPNLRQAVDLEATLVVGVGFLIADAMSAVAMDHPDVRFVIVDAVATDEAGEPLENVMSVLFKEHEGAYLAGLVAALTTETDHLSFIGGMEIPPVVRFLVGFDAALRTLNPDARWEEAYVGAFDDPAKMKEMTEAAFDAGADVVFEVGGGSGLGAYEAARERGPGHWVMGTDVCRDHLAPDNFLTSATKDVAGSIFDAAEGVMTDTFVGGIATLGLAEGRVGVCEPTFPDLPQEIQDVVQRAAEMIRAGEIDVPGDREELEAFTPPEL